MSPYPFFAFTPSDRRRIMLLIAGLLLWCGAVFGLWAAGFMLGPQAHPSWSGVFLAVQLFGAVQVLRPVPGLQPQERSRWFYLFWGGGLAAGIWLLNQSAPAGLWGAALEVLRSGLLLLTATVVGAVLARYVRRLWEIVPVCLVMALADFVSWFSGPTADFAQAIEQYYRAPEGPAPLIDMVLIKFALPGSARLVPVFGVSDWIMVVFFAVVSSRHGVNDNLFGRWAPSAGRQGLKGAYFPISAAALLGAVLLAHASGIFVPALPVISLVMLLWYFALYLLPART